MPWECKNISCQKASGFFPSDFEFLFSAKFRDLLTSGDVISVLICISSIAFYSVLQYKHFEVWLVVLWFTVLEITTIFLSPTPKLSARLNSKRRTLWRHFWSYCRVTKSLPSLFCYATWSSSWKWRETSRTFFFTRGPPRQTASRSTSRRTWEVLSLWCLIGAFSYWTVWLSGQHFGFLVLVIHLTTVGLRLYNGREA